MFHHDALRFAVKGNLATMLSAATNAKTSPETGDLSLQVQMVAGGVQPTVPAAVAGGGVNVLNRDVVYARRTRRRLRGRHPGLFRGLSGCDGSWTLMRPSPSRLVACPIALAA